VVSFTVWQALLSVLISTLLAIPVARALARQPQFPGRGLLLRLMELSLVMPSIVVVSGLVNVYGRQGWLTGVVSDFIPALQWNLYGLNGIVLAHVFFNAPLIARILLQALEAIPQSQKRLASQMGLRGFMLWRVLDWPAMKPVLPGLLALVTLPAAQAAVSVGAGLRGWPFSGGFWGDCAVWLAWCTHASGAAVPAARQLSTGCSSGYRALAYSTVVDDIQPGSCSYPRRPLTPIRPTAERIRYGHSPCLMFPV
jgi:ABC-type molybdate transport system permease subunit